MAKEKINAYVEEEVWQRFLQKVFERHGKTSGGAISGSVQEAIELWMKKG